MDRTLILWRSALFKRRTEKGSNPENGIDPNFICLQEFLSDSNNRIIELLVIFLGSCIFRIDPSESEDTVGTAQYDYMCCRLDMIECQ